MIPLSPKALHCNAMEHNTLLVHLRTISREFFLTLQSLRKLFIEQATFPGEYPFSYQLIFAEVRA